MRGDTPTKLYRDRLLAELSMAAPRFCPSDPGRSFYSWGRRSEAPMPSAAARSRCSSTWA